MEERILKLIQLIQCHAADKTLLSFRHPENQAVAKNELLLREVWKEQGGLPCQ